MDKTLIKRFRDKLLVDKFAAHGEVAGYQSPTSGRITYNKVVGPRSFAAFTDIVESIVPLDAINDANRYNDIPSLARVLSGGQNIDIYPRYLVLNATMDEYMDYEDEEDQENMGLLMDGLSQPTAGIAVQKSEAMGSAHAIAFVAWTTKQNRFKFAYYDPLAYKRGSKTYDFAEKAFVAERFPDHKIEFINLNTYCFRATNQKSSDFHCSQYVINAEYCYLYSAYFIDAWIQAGAKLHRASFKKAITASYIVKPELLTRANTKESMIYRVVMMAFICRMFSRFLGGLTTKEKKLIKGAAANLRRIKVYLKEFKELYGFDLLDP